MNKEWFTYQDDDDSWIQKMLEDEEMQQAIEEQMAGHLVTELVQLAKDKE